MSTELTSSPRGGHLEEDTLFDLLLDLLPDREWDEATDHLARCPACEELLRRGGERLERRRIS
jgi:hypothetical protein